MCCCLGFGFGALDHVACEEKGNPATGHQQVKRVSLEVAQKREDRVENAETALQQREAGAGKAKAMWDIVKIAGLSLMQWPVSVVRPGIFTKKVLPKTKTHQAV